MTSDQHEPTDTDTVSTDTLPLETVEEAAGTDAGNPIAGVEIDEEKVEEAVEPDDNAFEVDGPQAGHA